MQRDHLAYLLDMLFAARDARSFTEGLSYDEFVRDRGIARAAGQR